MILPRFPSKLHSLVLYIWLNRGGIGNLRLWVQIFNPPVNPWVKNLNTRMVYLKTDGYNIISNLWVIIFFAPKERCPRAKNLNTKEISSLVEFLGFLCENFTWHSLICHSSNSRNFLLVLQ